MNRLLLLPLIFLSAGVQSCVNTKIEQLPTYAVAVSMDGPESPRVFYVEQIDAMALPAAAPIVTIEASSADSVGRDALAASAAKEASKVKADFVLVGDAASYQSGSTHHYIGFGMGFSQNTYGQAIGAVAWRVCPSKMGFWLNENSMVMSISNESVREGGLQEGDTLVSVNGAPMTRELNSPHYGVALSLMPGDVLELVWIRPGEGRMSGQGKALENKPTHLDIPESFTPKTPAQQGYYADED